MTKENVSLQDKYLQTEGQVFISANQALVRLPLDQARRDRAASIASAGYISGYRGSPLGVYDSALWHAQALLDEYDIVFQPGLNEELAVSAIRGTQELAWFGSSQYEGIFGLWYGKGIGVDRACESLKLGNLEGAAAKGGFLVVAGDDHGGKSSDSAHQSEQTLMAAMVPILYPATTAEIIEFGLFGWAMSRFSGCYIGLKCVTDTLDISARIELPNIHKRYAVPQDIELPPEGLNLRPNLPPLTEEAILVNHRLSAATAFARSNGIDRVVFDAEHRELSIISAGKAYLDVRQALSDLGLDENRCRRLGIRLYKPGLIWPMDGIGLRDFTRDSRAVFVVEEKRPVMEEQITSHLYLSGSDNRPPIAGKADLLGAPLLTSVGELTVQTIRLAITTLLDQLGIADEIVSERAANWSALRTKMQDIGTPQIRPAYFCSGCPHNTSTVIPEGAKAMGGIGCHGLVAVVMDRDTMQFMPMGHEGSPWMSVSRFVDRQHMFQNMGDGTYSHSGLLAIRAAVAAGVNITYKVLYNDAVAMTGGQPVEQQITPVEMVRQLLAEGVGVVRFVAENPGLYSALELPSGASLHARDELDVLQRELQDIEGVTAIVYEQTCAAEKRRRRKRGLLEDPATRVFINPAVCEGCGDCSVQSNCLSVQPLETEFGRKRKIDQSSCNKDYSCARGFCPSFVTVEGATITAPTSVATGRLEALVAQLPEPPSISLPSEGYNVLVAGVGGTGVLTIGALLGMAAHLDNKACTVLDTTGMAQKGGAVSSHIRIGSMPEAIHTSRLSEGMTDLLLACDMVVSAGPAMLRTIRPNHTTAILNTDVAPTGDFQSNKYLDLSATQLRNTIADALGAGDGFELAASTLATELTGDSIATNLLMLGFAAQKGLLPLSLSSIEQAITLNGSFVAENLRTLGLGRLCAQNPDALQAELAAPKIAVILDSIDDVLNSRMRLLTQYQNAAYANTYHEFIAEIRNQVNATNLEQGDTFVREVALSLAKLMSYKDEYEVARLYSEPEFMSQIRAQFSGDFDLRFSLAPPFLPGRDASGRPKKRSFGSWIIPVFSVLSKLKILRGTHLDLFGYFPERKIERQLIWQYRDLIEKLAGQLDVNNASVGIEIAAAAAQIGGYGPVKTASVQRYHASLATLLQQFDAKQSVADDPHEIRVTQL